MEPVHLMLNKLLGAQRDITLACRPRTLELHDAALLHGSRVVFVAVHGAGAPNRVSRAVFGVGSGGVGAENERAQDDDEEGFDGRDADGYDANVYFDPGRC